MDMDLDSSADGGDGPSPLDGGFSKHALLGMS